MCRPTRCDDLAAPRHTVNMGIAMQLTNICRDITEDAAAGRRNMPASMPGNLNPQLLVDSVAALQPRLPACIDNLLDTADRYYRSGEAGLAYLPVGARRSILVAARVCHAIGTRLRQQGNAYWPGRTVVPRRTRRWVTGRALLSTPLSPSFWVPAPQHDAMLHGALTVFLGAEAPPESRHVKRT